jgi:hypothetical protein
MTLSDTIVLKAKGSATEDVLRAVEHLRLQQG